MTGKSTLRIGRLLGIELRLHYSWFAVFVLVVWSLEGQHFPMMNPGWAPLTYWWVGILTSVLFFASLVVHELAHSVAAQALGVPVRHITLFIFGRVASLGRETRQAREEHFPVVEGDRLEGLLTLQRIKEVPRERWPSTCAAQIVTDPATLATVQPDEDLFRVLERMTAEETDHFPVTGDGQLLGMISRDALVSVARIRSELQLWNGASPDPVKPSEVQG